MQSLTKAVLISCIFSAPVVAFGQTASMQANNAPLTRAEVRADLVRLEQAGYRPSRNYYPANIQAAEAKVAAMNDSGRGGVAAESGESGQSGIGYERGPR